MKKKYLLPLSILIVLIIARLLLPHFVTRYVNKVLADIEGYQGQVSDIDISLITGAYVINDLEVYKKEGQEKVPFVAVKAIDLSVEWRALFHGSIVGELIFDSLKLNFVGNKSETDSAYANQNGSEVDWTKPIKDLMPLKINRLEVVDGSISYYDFSSSPKVGISIENFDLLATNLSNVINKEDSLPARITASATSIGNGNLQLDMGINLLKVVPDFDIDLRFEDVEMTSLNEFFQAYAGVDVEKGVFNMYLEMMAKDGLLEGYLKPIIENLDVVEWDKDKDKPLNLLWQLAVGALMEIFENQKENQVATRVPIKGQFSDIETSVFPVIWNVFKNAFVEAFSKNTDDVIDFTVSK